MATQERFRETDMCESNNLGSPFNVTVQRQSMVKKELVDISAEGRVLVDPVPKLLLRRVL